MSFQIYLPCFGKTENLGLSLAAIRALSLVDEADSERDCWRLRYEGLDSCDIGMNLLLSDAGKLASLSLDRPCRDLRQLVVRYSEYGWGRIVFSGSAANHCTR